MSVQFSICMVNYNMARTLRQAVGSVAGQLDDRFEIVLVDDGSSDASVAVMHELAAAYPMIRVIELMRSPDRKLGETRNISIREARGDYCLLHLDCDDVYAPHINAWVAAFLQIEATIGTDILLAGEHIHMAKRDVLLKHGPYINIFRGEDRNMYSRFMPEDQLWFLDHVDFATRLPKTKYEQFLRTIHHTFNHMVTDFRTGSTFFDYLRFEWIKAKERSPALILYRYGILPVTWLIAQAMPPITIDTPRGGHEQFADYRTRHKYKFADLVRRLGGEPNWNAIPEESRGIFE
ncbi:MAG: glycosyltransferase family A protein [Rhodospirillales bacterium]